MKRLILLILSGIALFAFIFTSSMLWYNFFYNGTYSIDADNDTDDTVSSIEVQLDDDNTISEGDLIPLDKEMAKNIEPYSFRVKNTNSVSAYYNVIIEDAMISNDVNYSSKELLLRNQLEYQLSLNGKLIKTGMLSDIRNNILDSRTISENETNNYELRMYVSESALDTNWQNKYYHFNINVQTEVK